LEDLAGKVAVITGGGTGIGAAVAEELARCGSRVILISRQAERLKAAAERLATSGHDAEVLVGDIQSEGFLTDLDQLAPRVDVLVNNAAVFAPYGTLEEVPMSEIDAVLDIDLRAALRLVRHVLPGMKARGFGRVINIGSVAGSLGAAGQVAYSTAKAALQGLTRSVAIECARSGVTCNLVEPGLVETERVLEKIAPEVRAHLIAATPVGRAGATDEIAHAVAYLASPASGSVTGALLPVDGGIGLR
jgi:3-oxoacyl-[acyl-carrier protein] reductase